MTGSLRRRVSVVLVAGGALALCSAGVAPSPASAGVACADADIAVATGIVMSCTIAEGAAQPDQPQPGTRAYTVTVDLDAPGVVPRVVMANDRVLQPVPNQLQTQIPGVDEVVSSMADRSGAVVGINGGYFDIFRGLIDGDPDPDAQPYTGAICGGAVIDGEIWKSPPSSDIDDETARLTTALYVTDDGAMAIGQVGFAGSVTVGAETQPLGSVNDIASAIASPLCPTDFTDEVTDGESIALLTPRLGATILNPGPNGDAGYTVPTGTSAILVTLAALAADDGTYTVSKVEPRDGLTAIPPVDEGELVLLGTGTTAGTGGEWLTRNATVGATVEIATGLTLDGDELTGVRTLIGGAAQIVDDGQPVATPVGYVPASGGSAGRNAETVVGLDATGRQVTVTVFDRTDGSPGVWWQEAAGGVAALGVEDAILFDGGGSTTLVAQLGAAGDPVTVVNTPQGDNQLSGTDQQRYVGDGLVFLADPIPAPVPAPVPVLPVTGPPGGTPLVAGAGALLMLVGLGALVETRRRRRTG